jgi:hypothetical protein
MPTTKSKAKKKKVKELPAAPTKTVTNAAPATGTNVAAPVLELHVCMGLNACKGHGVNGTGDMAGTGECATAIHTCHGSNECRGQGGCGYLGDDAQQGIPGEQACKWNGSCASPINVSRVSTKGANKGKSVWKLARSLFETRMYLAGVPFGPSPGEGLPDDIVPDYEQGDYTAGGEYACPSTTPSGKKTIEQRRGIKHAHR